MLCYGTSSRISDVIQGRAISPAQKETKRPSFKGNNAIRERRAETEQTGEKDFGPPWKFLH